MNAQDRAAGAVERWVRSYTVALPRQIAAERLDEVRSDLWEHRAAGATGSDILRRAAGGAPADLAWRWNRGVIAPWLRPGARLAAIGISLFTLASIQHATGVDTVLSTAMYVLWFVFAFLALVAVLVGGWRRFRRRR